MGNVLESEKEDDNSPEETRTEGDGMDETERLNRVSSGQVEGILAPSLLDFTINGDSINQQRRLTNESVKTKSIEKYTIVSQKTIERESPKQLPPRDKLIVLKPQSAAKSLTENHSNNNNNNNASFNKIGSHSNKQKEPKFVPYEPYKGATRPMTENSVKTHSRKPSCGSSIASASSSSTHLHTASVTGTVYEKGESSEGGNLNATRNRDEQVTTVPSHNNDNNNHNASGNLHNYNNNLDMELSGHSLLLLKERLKINEKDILELRVENSRLKKMLVDSLCGGSTPSNNADTSHSHTSKCQLDATECSSMSESVDNLTDEIEVWRSKFLSTCVLVEQLTKNNQDWKNSVSSAATIFRELKQRSEVLTPELFDKINSWLICNGQIRNSSSISYDPDITVADHSPMSHHSLS